MGRPEASHPGDFARCLTLVVVLSALYATLGVFLRHGTLGRRLTHTFVIAQDGSRLTWQRGLRRAAFSAISVAMWGAGFFWAIVDRRRRTWHDILSGTVTVSFLRQ
jgi:uncharacterized RDD family membrane protein YckC